MAQLDAFLMFKGYFSPDNVNDIPEEQGIYAAFTCREVANGHEGQLVYIGKAEGTDNIRKRVDDHINNRDSSDSGKQSYWEQQYCRNGETIVYAYAIHHSDLGDIESALIYKNRPAANIYHREKYNGNAESVRIRCLGDIGTLKEMVFVIKSLKDYLRSIK